jgi:O-antigen/teichoic acid export membrane protein
MRLISGDHVLAWADQAVVSAASFLALILLARWSGPSEVGIYAIGVSILALLLAAQDSLITRPYVIQMPQAGDDLRERAFGAMALGGLLSAVASLVLAACALTLFASGRHPEFAAILGALAAIIPFALLREYARRFSFAHFRMSHAFLLDTAVATVQFALLVWLGATGKLTAASAVAAAGVSCAAGGTAWLYLARKEFAVSLQQIRTRLKESIGLGKWLFSSQLIIQIQGYATHWLSLLIAGATVTGIYAACVSVVALANPLLFGFYNILTPKSVRVLKVGGPAALRRQAVRDALFLAALMAAFTALVFALGSELMRLLYADDVYQGHGHTLTVLALGAMAAAAGAPASIALAAAERARAIAIATAGATLLNIVLVWALMTGWGLIGAAYGILIAEIAGSAGRWIAFLVVVPSGGHPKGPLVPRLAGAVP